MNKRINLTCILGLCLFLPAGNILGAEDSRSPDADAGECAADEIDAGDYCIQVLSVEPDVAGAPKTTPFRKESMIPGVVRRTPEEPKVNDNVARPSVVVRQSIPAPVVVAQGGYGIQLGVFSSRDTAESVCLEIIQETDGAVLSPINRDSGTIWACLAGPYASEEAAQPDLIELQLDQRFSTAWIKSLAGMQLEAMDDPQLPLTAN